MKPGDPLTSMTLLGKLIQPRENKQWEENWRQFVELYTPLLQRWARNRTSQHADAEEIVAEVLKKVYRGLPGYTSRGEGSFRRWLSAICRNACNDLHDKRGRSPEQDGYDHLSAVAGVAPVVDFEEEEYKRALVARWMELMETMLDSQTRTVFQRLVVEGNSAAEVAVEFRTSERTVYRIRREVLERLRKEIGDFLE